MKLLGIITSTQIEADLVIEQLSEKEEISIQGKPFYKGLLVHNIPVVVCICGIGKANAAHGTTLLLERFKPDFVYNIGIAGAYPSSGLGIGDIAIAEKEIYGDEGLISKSEVRGMPPNAFIGGQKSEVREKDKINFYTMDKINIPLCITDGIKYYNEFPMSIPEKLKDAIKGNFVTVSTCTGILEKGIQIEKRFNAICENMEGAAIAHICTLSGIPVAEIRGISNIIQNRTAVPLNKSDIIKAAENVQRFFLETLSSLRLQ